ncbi:MAG: hypothetical protein HZA23_00390 [Nitrospirae bacterium]|nr:hypothetical protein [Nitrospirota bacterium]
MEIRYKTPLILLAILALVASGSAYWTAARKGERCAFDGAFVRPTAAIRLTTVEGMVAVFDSIACAQRWMQNRQPGIRSLTVPDAVSGQPIDASAAVYGKGPASGRIRAFAREEDLEQFLRWSKGEAVANPFGAPTERVTSP